MQYKLFYSRCQCLGPRGSFTCGQVHASISTGFDETQVHRFLVRYSLPLDYLGEVDFLLENMSASTPPSGLLAMSFNALENMSGGKLGFPYDPSYLTTFLQLLIQLRKDMFNGS